MTAMPHWPLFLGSIKDTTNSLERVKKILNLIENPEAQLKGVVHITGTNGKGSTANYITNILKEHGFSVNLYTSPHIYECNERIVINGNKITDHEIYFYFEKLRILCENNNIEPTLFEATTIVAFMIFAKTTADFNIIEVGMGGKNDATNVFENSMAVFTPIHIDHIAFLGSTPIENAWQKIDILKKNQGAVIGPQISEVNAFIKEYAKTHNCDANFFNEDYSIEKIEEKPTKMIFSFNNNLMLLDRPVLKGDHQLINAAVATMSVIQLGVEIEANKTSRGLLKTKWAVRMESIYDKCFTDILPSKSLVFIDGAHNISGAKVVKEFLQNYKQNYKIYIINGRSKNTDSKGFLEQFIEIADGIVAIRVTMEALAEPPEIIVEIGLKLGLNIQKGANIKNALEIIAKQSNNHKVMVVICGSLYLARDLKHEINNSK